MYGQGKTRGQVAKLAISAATNQACAAILLKDSNDPDFYFQTLASQYEQIREFGNSGTQKNLNGGLIKEIVVPLPSLLEQQRISEVANTWDIAIVASEKLLANSRNYWLALTGELLMPVPISTQRQAGSFPPSVQAGIPKLPPTPKGWRKVALGAHLHEINRPVNLEPGTEYTLVTVRRSRGGVDKRSVLLGSEIKTPTQFFVAAGDFLISKRQIVHGACGIVPAELDGAVVSNEYAVLGGDGEIDPRFLRYLSETTYFQQTCFHSSIGVHVEKMLFRTEQWLKRPFNIPPLDEQRRIVEILDTAKQQMALAEQQLALL
ncbi:MAG: restriction endonuclease subunit S, partial [Azonexus sp.]|nr:restriction endonuclease subunit S [Azonexus sp.]